MRKREGGTIDARQSGRERSGREWARQGTERGGREGGRKLACLCDCLFKSNVNNKRLYESEEKVDGELFLSSFVSIILE